ncbi:MAG: phytoene desaturase [Chitinophagaceae bacterium]|nr:phytoene desaturase [Chitinophagaceae bacterium]MCW5927917.1 phytoene desaturase [Chitinophagaceae bacterium]
MSYPNRKKVVVIGAGFSGLSAATCMAERGYDVILLEKNEQAGGRARMFHADGFAFDMGPSWYWIPDVIERYFNRFGKSVNDYFQLKRLEPSYQVIYSKDNVLSVPSDYRELRTLFETIEKGSAARLDAFLTEAAYKYKTGMGEFVYKPSVHIGEYAKWKLAASLFRLDMFRSFSRHIRQYFNNPQILQLLEFPVLFLGAMPSKTPALYSLMNYADICLGTWYPMGGMYELVKAMVSLAEEKGVEIRLNTAVQKLEGGQGRVSGIKTASGNIQADIIIGSADYHHIENDLLDASYRNYSAAYWRKRTMAPSCLLYYIGIGKRLPRLQHHNLFFEEDFGRHASAIYQSPAWPENPLFYVCCPSKTDPSVAPAGMENLFMLIPVAAGLQDTEEIRENYYNRLIGKLEEFCGEPLREHIVYKKSYAASNFIADYNAYKGNAYGLANTLRQTAFFKPSIRSKRLKNLFFAGQLTVPGPGVPPAVISGQVVADYICQLK